MTKMIHYREDFRSFDGSDLNFLTHYYEFHLSRVSQKSHNRCRNVALISSVVVSVDNHGELF